MGTGEGEREGGSEGKRLRLQAAPGPPLGWIRGARSQYRAVPPPRGGAAPACPIPIPVPIPASARGCPRLPLRPSSQDGWGARPLPANQHRALRWERPFRPGASPGDAADTGTEPVLLLPRANKSDARIWCEGSSRV